MTIKSRIAKLEKERKPQKYTWREFVDGTAEIDPEEWRAFIWDSYKESEHE